MVKKSAGLLMYRLQNRGLEVLLVHSGGPYWVNRCWQAWTIPKGEIDPGEDPFAAAQREFFEETGLLPQGEFHPLQPVRQAGGKLVFAWAFEGNFNPADLHSNTFTLEWPPRSGILREFPEVDQAAWFSLEEAKQRIIKAQGQFLDELVRLLEPRPGPSIPRPALPHNPIPKSQPPAPKFRG
jgi:predicted NUDIX family NTP pyrophosphohydrolase